MIRWMQNYFASVTPMYVDGALYVAIAFFGALAALFSSDEAAKYLSPEALFWTRGGCGVVEATVLSLKMYRSTSFADHLASKKTDSTPLP
jgi:hypothetical protein